MLDLQSIRLKIFNKRGIGCHADTSSYVIVHADGPVYATDGEGGHLHFMGLNGRDLGSRLAALSAMLIFVAPSQSGPVVKLDCPDGLCSRTIVQPVSMFGEDERRTERQYARQRHLSLLDVQNRYAASGAITCTRAGRRTKSVINASGQLTVRRNLITTTAHTIIDKNARLIGSLENCVFETRVDGRKVRARLTSDYIAGFRDSRDSKFSGFDWAVIRLSTELPVEPYQVNDELTSLFGFLDVANVIKVANFNFDNWGASRTRTKSLADCVIRPEIVAWSSGVRGLRTDCDISPGNSGGAVLSELSGSPKLVGIIVGTTATSFKTRKPFDLYNDYNIGALVEGEFLQAIRDMASKMSVREVQAALNELGYDPGPADNVAGRRTRDAIGKFQADSGMTVTGQVSGEFSLALAHSLSASKQPGNVVDAKPEFDAASDAIVSDLYRWRVSEKARAGSERAARPDWLGADLATADVVGPQSAWASAKLRGCRNTLACLEAFGAPTQALRAAYALEKTGLIGTYVSSFIEYGKVDLVSVGFPYNTGGTVEYALVNGNPSAISLRSGEVLQAKISDSRYDRFRRENSKATIRLTPRLEGHRLMSGGGQRFVFAFPVTTGCLTCKASGQILMAYEFDADGRFNGLRPLAYSETDGQLDRQVRRTFPVEDLTGDPALVQRRLNGLGYEAGPIDGVFGRKTRSAIAEFQSDHSVAPSGEIDALTLDLLASDGARRQIRRFETLLRRGEADGFGRGLLNRIGQMRDSTTLHRASLANNLAVEAASKGDFKDAGELLHKAEIASSRVRSKHPALYAAVLVNLAANQYSMQEADLAGKTIARAAEFLQIAYPRGKPIVAAGAISVTDRPDIAPDRVMSAMRDFLVSVGAETKVRIRKAETGAGTGPEFGPDTGPDTGNGAHLRTLLFDDNEQES